MNSADPLRRRLLRQLLESRGVRPGSRCTSIGRYPRPATIPLSFNQEALWFIDRLGSQHAAYGIPAMLRLRGRLDLESLQTSLTAVIGRHESLRTTFREAGGVPHQVITPPADWTLPVVDLGRHPGLRRESVVSEIAAEETGRPFDLENGPLVRSVLVRMDEDDHALIMNLHHIIADGWSMGLLLQELSRAYRALSAHGIPDLAELPVSYVDFAIWQREHLDGPAGQRLAAYWAGRLDGAPRQIELPATRSRPRVPSNRGRHHPIVLSGSLTARLRLLGRRMRAGLHTILLAAFEAMLHGYSGQRDIVVATTFSNRVRSELEPVIGYFANTLPLRTDLSGNPSFLELVSRVGDAVVGAHAHQEYPFSRLVKDLRIPRDSRLNPVYQVVFDVLTPDRNPAVFGYGLSSPVREALHLHRLTATPLDIDNGVARFDLAVFLWDLPSGLAGSFEYSTDLFDDDGIAGLVENFESVLSRIVDAPEARLLELSSSVRQA